MKSFSFRLALSVLFVGVLSLFLPASKAAPVVETVARLGGNPDGYHPRAGLIDGGDGFFYGTTEAGGPPNCGTVYKVTPDGTLTTLYAFTGKADGANPIGGLVKGTDGNFYGTTSGAGSGGTGTVFKLTAAGALTTLHSFGAITGQGLLSNDDGAHPHATLIQGRDGNFYGTANIGGPNAYGTVFRISAAGAFAKLADFNDDDTDTGKPTTALVESGDGNFYGALTYGGNSSYGRIYEVTPAGVLSTIHDSNGSDGAAYPVGLVRGSDGTLYGTTQVGGSGGTVFKLGADGTPTTLHTFNFYDEGVPSDEPLVLGSDGNFYGATKQTGQTGYGRVFRLTPGGSLTLLAYVNGSGRQNNSGANGVLLGGDGAIYGTTRYTGNGDAGAIYKVKPGSPVGVGPTTLHLFSAGGTYCKASLAEFPDGAFYGVTQQGGATGDGTIFGVTPDGTIETVHNFNGATEGKAPGTRLTPDGAGNYYGTCDLEGPNGGGCIYVISAPAATTSQARQERGAAHPQLFDSDLGVRLVFDNESPAKGYVDPLIEKLKDRDYIKFVIGGELGQGGFEDYTTGPDNNSAQTKSVVRAASFTGPTTLYKFTGGADGANPRGALVTGADGNYYGVTAFGGTNNQGTVFRLTPDGVLTTLHAFAGTGDGMQPQAGLALAGDGNFYGTTAFNAYDSDEGVYTGNGTVFRVTPDGQFTTLHAFADDKTEGAKSLAALLLASDGKLYGVTSAGGQHGDGAVFAITTDGAFSKVSSLTNPALFTYDGENSTYGSVPTAALIQGSDGNLYGTTTRGGTEQSGVVYKVTLNPTTVDAAPVVTLSTAISSVTAGSGQIGEFLLTLDQAASTDLHINLSIKGTAANGEDYLLLKTSKKIKAGKTSKAIKIKPEGDLGGVKKTVKLTLAPGDGYTVGTMDKAKVKLLPVAQ